MAVCEFMGGEDFMIKLSRASTDVDEIAKKAVYAGAEVVADAMGVNLRSVLSDEATGELAEAMGITPITLMDGSWTANVGFVGYDSEGVAFQLIARAIESGTTTQDGKKKMEKRPFVRKTMNQTRKQVKEVMIQVVDEEMRKIFG